MRKRILGSILIFALVVCLAAVFAACSPVDNTPQKEGVSIYFMTHGGSRVDTITERPGTPITPPADPVREGYFFVGWYPTQKAAEAHNTAPETLPTVMPSKSVTYHAGWSDEGAVITLDANGGQLDVTQVSAAVGAKLTELMRQYVPTVKEGVEFVGWYKDGVLIDESMTVSAEGTALQARYKAYFVVNVYKEGLDGAEALDERESIRELADIGASRTYTYKNMDGFERTSDLENTSRTVVIGMEPSENVIEVHYARLRVEIYFLKGKDGAQGEEYMREINFGEDTVLPTNPFALERHRFAGWKVGDKTFAEGDTLFEEDMVVTNGRIDVVALWDERFEDISGGVDELWLLASGQNTLELIRENLPKMTGTLFSSGNFSITTESGTTLRGRILRDEGLFTWDLGFEQYVVRYVGTDDGDGHPHASDHARLYDPQASEMNIGGETLKGRYHFSDPDGVYVFECDGEEDRVIYFSVFELDGTRYFALRENLPITYSYTGSDGKYELTLFEDGHVELFKGVKVPYWLFRERVGAGTYQKSGDAILLDIDGTELDGKKVKIQPYGKTVTVYDAAYDGTFAVEGGGSLVIDGFSGATYTDAAGVEEQGEFYIVDGDIVFFGLHRSQHFQKKAGGVAIKGDPEVYMPLVSADGTQSIVINGHGKLRYVNSRGRVFYAEYFMGPLDDERDMLKFAIDTDNFCFLLTGDIATPTGEEMGIYSSGDERLVLDGQGGATYEAGGEKSVCTYEKRTQAPYDFELKGEASFRFMLDGDAFKKHDDERSGEFDEKFGDGALLLDGYGAAQLTKGGVQTGYTLPSVLGDDLTLTADDGGELKVRLHRSASGGTFVIYDESRDFALDRYDASYFDEDGDNVDAEYRLSIDGYDGATLSRDGKSDIGLVESVSEDGIFGLTVGEERMRVKVFAIQADGAEKRVFAIYEEQYDLSLTNGAEKLRLDGYATLTYTLAEGEARTGLFAMWGGIITAHGFETGGIEYFEHSDNTFTRCTELVIDGGVVKRYIGDGGDVSLPGGTNTIADGAFKGSRVVSVQAGSLSGGIGDSAFEGCMQLERVTVTAVASVGERAFFGCESLAEFTGGEGSLQTVGAHAFEGCISLAAIRLQTAVEIGVEAFKNTSVSVTLGAQNLGELTIRDRAFAHRAGDSPKLVWTSTGADMPKTEGDPFAFDGEGENKFVIVVTSIGQLSTIYNDANWKNFAGYVSFETDPAMEDAFSVTSLEKVHFGAVTSFDGGRWTYYNAANGEEFISYDGTLTDRMQRLSISRGEDGITLTQSGTVRFRFVAADTLVSYTAEDGKTLDITMSDAAALQATFDGRAVQLSRDGLTFFMGAEYEYAVQLFADGTFTYSYHYARQSIATYTNGESVVTMYKTTPDGAEVVIDGNFLIVTDVANGNAQTTLNFDEVIVSFYRRSIDDPTTTYFSVYTSDLYECYLVEFTAKGDTYDAKINVRYESNTYLLQLGMGRFEGQVKVYWRTIEGEIYEQRARIQFVYNGETYIIEADIVGNGSCTVTLDERYPQEIRGKYTVTWGGAYAGMQMA